MTGGWLDRLPEEVRRRVLASGATRVFDRGQIVFYEGDPAESLYVIESGRVVVQVSTPAGDVAAVNVLGPGQAFGELALVRSSRTRTATIRALEKTRAVMITRGVFEDLRRRDPSVDRFLVELLADDVDRLSRTLLDAYRDDVPHRCAKRLAELAPEGAEPPIEIAITQEDFASMVGATRPSTNQALNRLQERGIIRLSRGKLVILDPGKLIRAAGR